jgi:hypothetical protein
MPGLCDGQIQRGGCRAARAANRADPGVGPGKAIRNPVGAVRGRAESEDDFDCAGIVLVENAPNGSGEVALFVQDG